MHCGGLDAAPARGSLRRDAGLFGGVGGAVPSDRVTVSPAASVFADTQPESAEEEPVPREASAWDAPPTPAVATLGTGY